MIDGPPWFEEDCLRVCEEKEATYCDWSHNAGCLYSYDVNCATATDTNVWKNYKYNTDCLDKIIEKQVGEPVINNWETSVLVFDSYEDVWEHHFKGVCPVTSCTFTPKKADPKYVVGNFNGPEYIVAYPDAVGTAFETIDPGVECKFEDVVNNPGVDILSGP